MSRTRERIAGDEWSSQYDSAWNPDFFLSESISPDDIYEKTATLTETLLGRVRAIKLPTQPITTGVFARGINYLVSTMQFNSDRLDPQIYQAGLEELNELTDALLIVFSGGVENILSTNAIGGYTDHKGFFTLNGRKIVCSANLRLSTMTPLPGESFKHQPPAFTLIYRDIERRSGGKHVYGDISTRLSLTTQYSDGNAWRISIDSGMRKSHVEHWSKLGPISQVVSSLDQAGIPLSGFKASNTFYYQESPRMGISARKAAVDDVLIGISSVLSNAA